MPELNSQAFETAIAAGMKLHASKRLNTMTNDDAMKALATEMLQTYMAIAIDGARNATCKGGLQVGYLISYAKWRGDYRILESDIGDPAAWDNSPDVVLPIYCNGASETLDRYRVTTTASGSARSAREETENEAD